MHHTASPRLANHVASSRRVSSPFSQPNSSSRRTLNERTPHSLSATNSPLEGPKPKENTSMNEGQVAINTKAGNAARTHRNDTTRHTTPAASKTQPSPYVNPNGANHGNQDGEMRTANSPNTTKPMPGRVSNAAESTRRRLGFPFFSTCRAATVSVGFGQTKTASPLEKGGRTRAWKFCPRWRQVDPRVRPVRR